MKITFEIGTTINTPKGVILSHWNPWNACNLFISTNLEWYWHFLQLKSRRCREMRILSFIKQMTVKINRQVYLCSSGQYSSAICQLTFFEIVTVIWDNGPKEFVPCVLHIWRGASIIELSWLNTFYDDRQRSFFNIHEMSRSNVYGHTKW